MIKQFTPSDYCLKCRGCCRFKEADSVWLPCLLEEEMVELADNNKIPAVAVSLSRRITPVPDPKGEGFICSLLDPAANKCRIYSCRPFECQLYPFLINVRDKKIVLTVDLNCPYVQENINSPEFKAYAEYLSDFLNQPQQLRLLKDNPQILVAYEEVRDLIELRSPDDPQKPHPSG